MGHIVQTLGAFPFLQHPRVAAVPDVETDHEHPEEDPSSRILLQHEREEEPRRDVPHRGDDEQTPHFVDGHLPRSALDPTEELGEGTHTDEVQCERSEPYAEQAADREDRSIRRDRVEDQSTRLNPRRPRTTPARAPVDASGAATSRVPTTD